MTIEVTQEGLIGNDTPEVQGGSELGNLFRDHIRALRLYSIDIENARRSVLFTVTYIAFLSAEIFFGLLLGLLISTEEVIIRISLELSFGAFCMMLLFFFIMGHIYRSILGKRLGISYISYVYVVTLSMTYYPFMMFIGIVSGPIVGFLFTIVSASISRFLIISAMLRGHVFESNRDRFMLGIVTFLLQWGFIISGFSLLLFLR